MKKYLFICLLVFSGLTVFAQKFAYVDTEYILKHLPEYKSSLSQLNVLSEQWQQQVDNNFGEIDKMYKAYQADQVLLTEDMRKRRENEIIEKEKQAKDFQRKIFGPDGDLFQSRTKLLSPLQDKVTKAIAEIAKAKFLDFIFDKSSEATMMIYASSTYDLSNDVIVRLGYKPGTVIK
ncbi:MAG: OmpH family outer membrane protein [Bacteroidota bacterium]